MNNIILKAQLESYRLQLLLSGVDKDGNFRVPPAYYYAVSHRIFPYFHQEWCGGEDPFSDVYNLKKDFIEDVVTYVDGLWIEKKPVPTFYELEDKYGRDTRANLIQIFRYCFLNDGFDVEFYRALLAPMKHPSEAGGLCRKMEDYDTLIM